MNAFGAIALSPAEATQLGRLRCLPGLEVCPAEDRVWLRFEDPELAESAAIKSLPGVHYNVLADRQLVAAGQRVPRGHLPTGNWQRLDRWLSVVFATPALPAQATQKAAITLVRGGAPREAELLLTNIEAWRLHVTHAPRVRLERWSFALAAEGDVLVRGRPLPALAGVRFSLAQGIALPCGYTCSPAISAEVLRESLGLGSDDLALLHADGTWDRVRSEDFVRASRGALAASLGEVLP